MYSRFTSDKTKSTNIPQNQAEKARERLRSPLMVSNPPATSLQNILNQITPKFYK